MTSTPCKLLDDYLARDLSGDVLDCFRQHLGDCAECRQAVQEFELLSSWLTEATTRLELVPASLTQRSVRVARPSRWRRLAAAATALAAMAAAIWFLPRPSPRPLEPKIQVAAEQPGPASQESQSANPVRVHFPTAAHVFAVPQPTDSPNVTIVWVYPGRRGAASPAPVVHESSVPIERSRP
jgi:hypothetical protein